MPDISDLKITPPFGYDAVAPLHRTDRVRLPQGNAPDFCRTINAIALSAGEFQAAARDYPIVFASANGASGFAPVAVLGLADGQNLFVDDHGHWDDTTYVPAFVRRYPFCISRVYTDGKAQNERVICVARSHLDPQGIAQGIELYDASGAATPRWSPYEQLLTEYEKDLDFTTAMCETLEKLGLFTAFKFQIKQGDATGLTLDGMHRIDESGLAALPAKQIRALVAEGWMGRIYAHIHSLANFTRLYARAVARLNPPQATAAAAV